MITPTKKLRSKFKQGKFFPANPEKYKGTTPIYYRSSWELDAFRFLDMHPACVKWGSESVVLNYISPIDGNKHRYFIDLNATFKNGDQLNTFIIEIKPYRHTQPPKQTAKKKESVFLHEVVEYKKNMAKWEAAKLYCEKRGYKFIILTEKELFKIHKKK